MNLITMVPATAKFIAQMRAMRRYIVENSVTEFAVFQNWCDENNERWAEALDSGCAMLSRSSSPIGTVGRMQAVGNMLRRRTITFGITS